jgi:hypothetical protein
VGSEFHFYSEKQIDTARMQITVQVTTDVARALHQREPPNAESEALLRMIVAFGLRLEPMHPGTDDPHLISWFEVEVPNQASAQQVIDRIQESEMVKAAYIKPPDQLP